MFSGAEDEDLFNPMLATSSNLASLFDTSVTKPQSNASLTYTAPKQPRPGGQETPKSSPKPVAQSSVICSKFVDVFKLLDRHHISQGKCGLAIIGSDALKAYDVILYKSKQDIFMRTKLKPDFVFTIQNNDFAHFCDEQKQQWSVHFENSSEVDNFVQQLQVYGGRVVSNTQVTESNDTPMNNSSAVNPKPGESTGNSSDTNNHTKANILSRMAKMGQSILPTNLPKTSSGNSDSESEEKEVDRKSIKKRPKYVAVKGDPTTNEKENTPNTSLPVNMQSSAPVSEFIMLNGQLVPVSALKQNLSPTFSNQFVTTMPNQLLLSQPQVSPLSDSLHVFIAENRTHNCELRMNMTHMSSKLDAVLEKLNKSDSAKSLGVDETHDLLQSRLSKEIEKSNELQKKIGEQQDSIEMSRTVLEDLNLQNDGQKKIIFEQEEKIRYLEELQLLLKNENEDNKLLQTEMENHHETIASLNNIIHNQKHDLESLTKTYEASKEINERLTNSIASLKAQLDNKNDKADLFAKKLKQAMNSLYQQIMENFEDDTKTFQSVQIKQIVSQKLKATTFAIIQEFQDEFQNSQRSPIIESSATASSVPDL